MTTTTDWDALLAGADAAFTRAVLDEAPLVDVATITIDSPLGRLLVAESGGALVRIAFAEEGRELVLADLAARLGSRIVPAETELLARTREQVGEYVRGDRAGFDLPLDLRLAKGPFRRAVLELLCEIPVGETRTYAEVAARAGRPRAVRAVGSGCATNPLPLVVPCHRVLRTGGELGGYLGGVARKQWLLELEQRIAS